MNRAKKIIGAALLVWATVRKVVDFTESVRAAKGYAHSGWVYLLAAPSSGVLTVAVVVVGLSLLFSEKLKEQLDVLASTVRSWTKEYEIPGTKNVAAVHDKSSDPDVFLEWEISQNRFSPEFAHLKNRGKSAALSVRIGPFSWPNVRWTQNIEVQSIDPSSEEKVEAKFHVELGEEFDGASLQFGRILSIMNAGYEGHGPLFVSVNFKNSELQEFARDFTFRQASGGSKVLLDPGPVRRV
jgi:hypothetical protein